MGAQTLDPITELTRKVDRMAQDITDLRADVARIEGRLTAYDKALDRRVPVYAAVIGGAIAAVISGGTGAGAAVVINAL